MLLGLHHQCNGEAGRWRSCSALPLRSVVLSSDDVWREVGGGSRIQSVQTVPVWTGDVHSSCARWRPRAIRRWPHSEIPASWTQALRCQHTPSGKAVSQHFPPRLCPWDDVPVRFFKEYAPRYGYKHIGIENNQRLNEVLMLPQMRSAKEDNHVVALTGITT